MLSICRDAVPRIIDSLGIVRMLTSLPPTGCGSIFVFDSTKSDCHAAAMIFYYAEGRFSRG
jgi:hypothetical protein